MKARKLAYYLSSAAALYSALRLSSSNILPYGNKERILNFKSGLQLRVLKPLDLLIAKETLIDDCYRLSTLERPKRIIDIGAGLGDFSLKACQLYPNCEVFAFEKDGRYFNALLDNLRLNEFLNVTPYNVAVRGSSPELKGLLKKEVDLFKLDCEGDELEIVLSLSSQELSMIKKIALEYHRSIEPFADKIISDFLTEGGFLVERVPDKYDHQIGYIFAQR